MVWVLLTEHLQKFVIRVCFHVSPVIFKNYHMEALGALVATSNTGPQCPGVVRTKDSYKRFFLISARVMETVIHNLVDVRSFSWRIR